MIRNSFIKGKSGGFVQFLLLIIIALIVLEYFFHVRVWDMLNSIAQGQVVQGLIGLIKAFIGVFKQAVLIAIQYAMYGLQFISNIFSAFR